MVPLVRLALPEPRDEPLPRSPLRLVALQVRHTPADRSALALGLRVQDALGGPHRWRLEPIQTQTWTLSASSEQPPANATTVGPGGWQLTSETASASATLGTDSVSIETTVYPGWVAFQSAIESLVTAMSAESLPAAELRIGLRYVNRIEHPAVEQPSDWNRWIDSAVLGVVNHAIGPGITGTQQQIDMRITDEIRALIQHGLIRDQSTGKYVYLMDLDTYRLGARPFDPSDALSAVDRLHATVLTIFQSLITPELYSYLAGEGDDG